MTSNSGAKAKIDEPFRIVIRWGHLDRMPKCEHGRVICRSCGFPQ